MKGAKYQILNKFRESKIALGKDYSSNYSENKSVYMYFYNEIDGKDVSVITFKAFIESFSIDFGVEFEEESLAPGASGTPKDFKCEYKIKLNVPSISVNDSRLNAARFEELNVMMAPREIITSNGKPIYKNENIRVLMSNLIHNGSYKEEHDISSASLVKKYGLRCNIQALTFNGIPEAGFFEYSNKLFFKEYSCNLNLIVLFTQDNQINNNRYACGFSKIDGSYDSEDIKTWPFGV